MSSRWTVGSALRLRPGRTIVLSTLNTGGISRSITSSTLYRNDTKTGSGQPGTSSTPFASRSNNEGPSKIVDSLSLQKSLSALDLKTLRTRLMERANLLSAAASLSLAELSGSLNKVTGYEHIERLKHKVVETEAAIAAKRQASRDAKAAHEAAVVKRSNSQREVNDLLQRKSTWNDADVGRFTALVREDHLYEQEEAMTKAQVALAEAEVESQFNELMRTILNRYHEEQVWSDKIRSASTYGSLLVMGVNIAVFILAIIVVEPYKRRRLAETFEKRIEELSLENREMIGKGMDNIGEHFKMQESILAELAGATVKSIPVDHEPSSPDVVESEPLQLLEKAPRAARDREMWIAGALGAVGGGMLTFLLGYLR